MGRERVVGGCGYGDWGVSIAEVEIERSEKEEKINERKKKRGKRNFNS